MADQTVQPEAADAVDNAETAAPDVPARAPEPAPAEAPVEIKAKAVEPKPLARAKRPARRAAASKIEKAVAAPAPKPARKVKKTATKLPRKLPGKPVVTAAVAVATAKAVRTGLRKIKGANEMTNKTNDAGLFAAEQFKTVFGDVNERTKAAMERGAKVAEEIADLTRGNVEAFVASSKVAAKGVETLSQEAAEYSRKSFEEASAALKGFAEVKSATDFFKLQGDFARAAFDSAVAESARLSENVLKIVGEVAEPITNRYTVAAERAKTLAA